jgi:ABC-type branched-subunit amino acid transport system ATPase component
MGKLRVASVQSAGVETGQLRIKDVERAFYGVHALNGVSLDVELRGITGLIGPNGAGKTTLFNCISGVIPPDRGRIIFDGRDIPGEQIVHALLRSKVARSREAELMVKAQAIAERLNLRRVIYHPAGALSGGQKKLLEIGRALMADPKLILLDEPIAGVNPTLAREIGEHLQTLAAEGLPILLIEHQMDMVARLCDRVIVMAEGRYLTAGSFDEIAGDQRVQEAYMGRRARSAQR